MQLSPNLRKALQALLLAESDTLRNLRNVRSNYSDASEESIRESIRYLGEDYESVVFKGRMNARQASKESALRELSIDSLDTVAFTEEDRTRSNLVGLSLASAIGMSALILFNQKKQTPLKTAIALQDYRFRRVAATEVPNAYSRLHYEINPGEGYGIKWDATLDLKSCKLCGNMHGQITHVGQSFKDGMVPGDVHPNCRCIPYFVLQADYVLE